MTRSRVLLVPSALLVLVLGGLAIHSRSKTDSPAPPGVKTELEGIEASGLVYLADLDRFLVISDDTKKNRPDLFLMDSRHRLGGTLTVRGLDKIGDMEAISIGEDGALWLLSSQSRTGKGKLPDHRKVLAKVKRDGESLDLLGKAPLHDLLTEAAKENPGEAWARFLQRGFEGNGIDIEGMAVRKDGLYLGFKEPLLDGKAVILRLQDPEGLLHGKAPVSRNVSIWRALDLTDARTSTACGIADLVFVEQDLYLLSTGTAPGPGDEVGRHAGELWKLRNGLGSAERLMDFHGAKPEGLAYHAATRRFHITFDNGSSKPSQVMSVGIDH